MARIVIVDDQAANRQLLVTLLGYRRHVLFEAGDGEEALRVLAREKPDLVITDILMPQMDGFELVRRIRDDGRLADVPIVFYTAYYHEREARELAEACGVRHVLTKPCEPELVLSVVDEALKEVPARTSTGLDFDARHLRILTDKLSENAAELESAHERMTALIGINLELASQHDPEQLLAAFCHSARHLVRAEHALLRVAEAPGEPWQVASSGLGEDQRLAVVEALALEDGVAAMLGAGPARRTRAGAPGQRPACLPPAHPATRSCLAASVRSLTRGYGWICLTDKSDGQGFTDEDERLVSILAGQAGRIYENASLYAAVSRQAERLRTEAAERERAQWRLRIQYDAARILAETATVAEAAPLLLQSLCEALGYAAGEIWEMDAAAGHLRCVEVWTRGEGAVAAFAAATRSITFAPGTGMPGRVFAQGTLLCIPDVLADPRFARKTAASEAGLHGVVGFPVVAGGRPIGAMAFFSSEVASPDADVIAMFAALGSQIGQFVERKNQQARIARLARIQAVLSGINSLIVRVKQRDELFAEACRIAVRHGEFGIVWIGTFDAETQEITPVSWAGLSDEEVAAMKTSARDDTALGRGAVGEAIRRRRPIVDNDLQARPGIGGARRAEAMRRGYRSAIGLPLIVDGEVAGVIGMFARERGFFNDEEVKLLTELAGDVSFAMDVIAKEQRLHYLANYDVLTGLPNRELFLDRLVQALPAVSAERPNVAVGLVDLDRFAMINDSLGTEAGDELLRVLAERMRRTFAGRGTVARVGGDGFGIVLAGNWQAGAAAVAYEYYYAAIFAEPVEVAGEVLRPSGTVGIAIYPGDGDDAATLLSNAEAALKQAKNQHERVLFYGPEMNAKVASSVRLESRLRGAVGRGELALWYQPKVATRTRQLVGLEALMRWHDPQGNLVPPAEFIPIMEETGMIVEAGYWALAQAVRDARRWQAIGLEVPRIAVNVSAIQMRREDFVERVLQAVGRDAAVAGMIELEITESTVMENVDGAIRQLQRLAEAGFTVAIDDFGTGYSSLAYIARLPIHALKIDRGFVVGMAKTPEDMAVVTSIISLGHALSLKVIAEGVDSDEQAAQLWLHKCDELQGYLISKPLPPDRTEAMLRAPAFAGEGRDEGG